MTLPPAVDPLRCRHPDCTLPQGGRCARAAEIANPLLECPELIRQNEPLKAAPAQSAAAAQLSSFSALFEAAAQLVASTESESPGYEMLSAEAAPWRGRHLDLDEAEALAQRSPARVISVLGPYNAGKTCLLASMFLQLANGQHGPLPYRFASSRTLYGFHDLVQRANTWSGNPTDEIVLHTPRDAGGFLHLGLRPRDPADHRHIDVLFSDIPGEWVSEWTQRVDDERRRRLSFIPRSDGFVVVADAAALLGPGGPKIDHATGMLIRRLAGETNTRPRPRGLSLVFSKCDLIIQQVTPPQGDSRTQPGAWGMLEKRAARIWTAVKSAADSGMRVMPFAVSAFPQPLAKGQPVGVMDPFAHVMAHADRRERWRPLPASVPEGAGFFESLRRWEAQP